MATEKFFVFNEAGTLKRLKGRIVRFLDNEDPDNDDKVAIRSSLSVPGSAEGLTPANNLSDVSSVSTARDNLGVPSDQELINAFGLKPISQIVHYDGVDDYQNIAHNAALSFTDSINDTPGSIFILCRPDELTQKGLICKYNSAIEWALSTTAADKIRFRITDGTNHVDVISDAAITSYEGNIVSIGIAFGGAGPSSVSATSFALAGDEVTMYVNGEAFAATATNNASYTGMVRASDPVHIGRFTSDYFSGGLIRVALFNRELTAAEFKSLHHTGQIPDQLIAQWGESDGTTYSSDFSAAANGFTVSQGSVDGNIDDATSGTGENDALRLTINTTSGGHYLQKTGVFTEKRKYRLFGRYYIPSTNSHLDGIYFACGTSGPVQIYRHASPSQDAWINFSVEFTANPTADGDRLLIYGLDGNSTTISDAGGDDVLYLKDLKVTQLGCVLDLKSDNFNEAAGKWLDESDLNLNATNNGAVVLGARKHIKADSLDLSGIPTSSAGLASGEVYSNSGVLTIV